MHPRAEKSFQVGDQRAFVRECLVQHDNLVAVTPEQARVVATKMTTRIIAISPMLIALGAARPASSPSASAEK